MEMFPSADSAYQLTIVLRLGLAVLLGALVGLEREVHGRPAGFRTHLLVTVGACLMTIISEHYFIKYLSSDSSSAVRFDPSRVAAQIVTGIGFLGAGVILKEGLAVRGLTTAACLWVAAGIGMAVGIGLYLPALVVTLIALGSLLLMKRIERIFDKDRYRTLTLKAQSGALDYAQLVKVLRQHEFTVLDYSVERDRKQELTRYDLSLRCSTRISGDAVIEALCGFEDVVTVRFR